MTGIRTGLAVAAIAGAFIAAGTTPSSAQSVEQFYRNRTLSLIVGFNTGGAYDPYARTLARHLPDHLPGAPTIVVKNMPGAGSGRAAAYIFNVAPKDGTAIGAIFPGAVLQPLLSDQPVPHDPSKLVYLGSANSDVYVCYVRSDAPPFFVLHGEKDELIPSGQARAFSAALRGAGAPTVGHAELANAHHAFDITPTVRSRLAARAVADFLGVVYGRRASSLLDSATLSVTSAS